MGDFDRLQEALPAALAANVPGSGCDHVVVAMASFSLSESLLAHYGERIPAMEHRYLNASLMLNRIDTDIVFVCSIDPGPEVLTYYRSLVAPDVAARMSAKAAHRGGGRPVPAPARREAARPPRPAGGGPPPRGWAHRRDRAVERHRARGGGRPRARRAHQRHARRTCGRRRSRAPGDGCSTAPGVPVPLGREDVHRVDDVAAAAEWIRAARPGVGAVVIKHDDSGAGDGNVVLALRDESGADRDPHEVLADVAALPGWFLDDLAAGGGVVEEMVVGRPAAQPQRPGRPGAGWRACGCSRRTTRCSAATTGRSTSDAGSRPTARTPPTSPATGTPWAVSCWRAAASAGSASTSWPPARGRGPGRSPPSRSTCARAVRRTRSRRCAAWCPVATTPRRAPGSPTPTAAPGPTARATTSSTRRWPSAAPQSVIDAVRDAGLQFDSGTGTGVVLHMLGCLAVDGRFGVTAIGRTPDHADELYVATVAAVVPRGVAAVELSR